MFANDFQVIPEPWGENADCSLKKEMSFLADFFNI